MTSSTYRCLSCISTFRAFPASLTAVLCLLMGQTAHPRGSEDLQSPSSDMPGFVLDEPGSANDAIRRLEAYLAMVAELRGLIESSSYDLEALLEKLDYDAEKIISYVQKNIAYESYPGLLRGAENTLRGGAGNSFDQSLLLATLLKDAGYDARIAAGGLGEKASTLLFEQMGHQELKSTTIDQAAIANIIRSYSSRLGIEPNSFEKTLESINASPAISESPESKATEVISNSLLQSLEASGVELRPANSAGAAIMELDPYFWVQYRGSDSSVWTDAHTTLLEDGELAGVRPDTFYSDLLPENILQKVGVQVVIEQEINGRRRLTPLAAPWIRPTANISEQLFTLQVVPMSILRPVAEQEPVPANRSSPDIYFVLFNGRTLDSVFDTGGNVIPTSEAGTSYAALFATMSDKLNNAAGVLSKMEDKATVNSTKRIASLASVKIRYFFIDTGGNETVQERVIFDKDMRDVPNQDKSDNGAYLTDYQLSMLTRMFSFKFATARYSELDGIRSMLDRVEGIAIQLKNDLASQGRAAGSLQSHSTSESLHWNRQGELFSIFDSATSSSLTYRSEPHLIVHYETSGFYGQYREGMDVVKNTRRHRKPNDGVATLVRQGVWESITEGSLLSHYLAPEVFNMAFKIVKSQTELEKVKPSFSRFGFRLAQKDLRNGNVLAIDQELISRTPESPSVNTWWRIAATGQTLRMLDIGTGGEENIEYLTQQQVAKAMTCVIAVTGGCRGKAEMIISTSAIQIIGKNAKLIDAVLSVLNAISSGVGGPSIEMPPEGDFSGAGGAIESSMRVLKKKIFDQCLKRELPNCANLK